MSLREKKKIETKNKILEVSGRLFKEKGIENTTVDEITREAGIGKGTFFNYFPSKTALLLYFVELKEELTYSQIKHETRRSIPTKEKIKNTLVFVAKTNEKDKELTKMFVFEYLRHYGVRQDERKSSRLSNILYSLIEEGLKKGDVKNNIEVKKAADIISAIYFHSLMEWLWSETDYSFSEDISGKIDMIIEGIGC
ncbi:MAG: TetR/AcrR family transcriptional regulator [Candidatus Methanoperedens sp.]|nr:TetR/AcrR family transcriptional regulator [Candidatus Methanoperedens sp.]CAG0962459.1 HTH-type transcriptional regulator AcrR [Methanosarcinales archaeon]